MGELFTLIHALRERNSSLRCFLTCMMPHLSALFCNSRSSFLEIFLSVRIGAHCVLASFQHVILGFGGNAECWPLLWCDSCLPCFRSVSLILPLRSRRREQFTGCTYTNLQSQRVRCFEISRCLDRCTTRNRPQWQV